MSKQYLDAVALRLRDMGIDEQAARSFVGQAEIVDCPVKYQLLHQGTRAAPVGYLLDGYVRLYVTGENGDRWIRHFIRPGSFVGCVKTVLYNMPSEQEADCLTNCKLLLLPGERFAKIYENLQVRTQLQHLIIEQLLTISQERSVLLQMPARERYLYFLENYGDLVPYVLKADIASFLGIRQQSLSRILREFK